MYADRVNEYHKPWTTTKCDFVLISTVAGSFKEGRAWALLPPIKFKEDWTNGVKNGKSFDCRKQYFSGSKLIAYKNGMYEMLEDCQIEKDWSSKWIWHYFFENNQQCQFSKDLTTVYMYVLNQNKMKKCWKGSHYRGWVKNNVSDNSVMSDEKNETYGISHEQAQRIRKEMQLKQQKETERKQKEMERKQFEDERSFLLNILRREEEELKQQIETERQIRRMEQEKKYIVVYETGAMCRKTKKMSSKKVGVVPVDTIVTVEKIDGRRCLISSPMNGDYGWISLHTANGMEVIKKTKNEKFGNAASQQWLRANQIKQQKLMRKQFTEGVSSIQNETQIIMKGQKFIPSKTFVGSKNGYGFRKGNQGLGYYLLSSTQNENQIVTQNENQINKNLIPYIF
eukprot:545850_1